MTDRVKDILAKRYPSFQEPLRHARKWNRTGNPDDLQDASDLLDVLTTKRYPNALAVWYEAAFNRDRRKRPDETLELLTAIDRRFGGRLDEDTYALWGRQYKLAGHRHLDAGMNAGVGSDEQKAAFADADREYAQALVPYQKGYSLSGNWFPGVNVAFLLFLRGVLTARIRSGDESDHLLAQSAAAARALVAAGDWPRKLPDDDIWHEATRGEACALLGDWEGAVRHYARAAARPGALAGHHDSMATQFQRIIQGYGLLGKPAPLDLAARLPTFAPWLAPANP